MNIRKNNVNEAQPGRKRDRVVFIIALLGISALVTAALIYKHKRAEEARPGHTAPFSESDVALELRPDAKKHSILIISVDALRADHLSLYGYERETTPGIDAFFSRCSRRYERAYSPEAGSSPSIASLLSGLYPLKHGVRLLYQTLRDDTPILPDYLGPLGYQSAAVVSNIVLTDEAMGMAERFDHYDDHVDEQIGDSDAWQRRAARTTDAALSWVETKRDPEQPHLLWVHYVDPHPPYDPPDGWEDPFSHEEPVPLEMSRIHQDHRLPGITDGATYVDLYDSEIAYTDRAIGRLLSTYESLGLLEDTVVVFTADHGHTMMEHDRYFTHGYHVWESIVRVPLLIRAPECKSVHTTHPVSLVDLTPTLLDMVGLDLPEGRFDGLPLHARGPEDPISLEATLHGMGTRRALIRGHRKWHAFIHSSGKVVSRQFVDLKRSPGEDKLTEWPETGGELLDAWIEADRDPGVISYAIKRGTKPKGPKKGPQ